MDRATIARVANLHLVRKASREITSSRIASRVMTASELEAFGAFIDFGVEKVAFFGAIKSRLQKVFDLFKRAPDLWKKIKETLGIEGVFDAAKKIKDWAKRGKDALTKIIGKLIYKFPVALYFVSRLKMPGLTDVLAKIIKNNPKIQNALKAINTNVVQPLDRVIQKYIPNLARPLKAAIFIFIWINVAEISWDIPSLWQGFTGAISLQDLFTSFPESAMGAILAGMGVGLHLLPITIIARIMWLVAHEYMEWVPGKGLRVKWSKIIGDPKAPDKLVPTFG